MTEYTTALLQQRAAENEATRARQARLFTAARGALSSHFTIDADLNIRKLSPSHVITSDEAIAIYFLCMNFYHRDRTTS